MGGGQKLLWECEEQFPCNLFAGVGEGYCSVLTLMFVGAILVGFYVLAFEEVSSYFAVVGVGVGVAVVGVGRSQTMSQNVGVGVGVGVVEWLKVTLEEKDAKIPFEGSVIVSGGGPDLLCLMAELLHS